MNKLATILTFIAGIGGIIGLIITYYELGDSMFTYDGYILPVYSAIISTCAILYTTIKIYHHNLNKRTLEKSNEILQKKN
jgi:hypothetical protein